jgi:acyl-homoserine-lactone acylase
MIQRTNSIHYRGLFIALFACFVLSGMQAQTKGPEILWDNYGVPHIYGKNIQEQYYAFGWAQMENHANLMLQLYAKARGCASEYWGKNYLESDKKILLFDLPGQAKRNYHDQDSLSRTILDAFVKGVNDYASKYPDEIADSLIQVLPVSGPDIIAHMLRVLCLEFLAAEDIYYAAGDAGHGSNAIAIAPSRSASGNSMLLTNPHLPWSDFFLWFEAHLNSPGFNAYGITLIGAPALNMAFNDQLGWAHTINPIDASDRYELTLQGDGYVLDGKTEAFAKKEISIRVRQPDGAIIPQIFHAEYSKQGPVMDKNGQKAYAVRVAGMKNSNIPGQYHKMAGAKDLAEFEGALSKLQIPMFNILYADKAGNILYLFGGNVPIRSDGDWAFWKGTIDGSMSKTIWDQYHPYKDLPRVLNPASGFLQNCNDPPWTCTCPPVLESRNFPPYMAPQGMHFRAQRAVNMIRQFTVLTQDQLLQCKFNTGLETADRFLDDLLEAVKIYGDSTAQRAAVILAKWDKATEAGSRGAILFIKWFDKLTGNMFKIPWNAADPFSTPGGLANPEMAVKLLSEAAMEVQQEYGALDVEWGSVHRFRKDGLDFPGNGGPGQYGIFRTIDYTRNPDGKKQAFFGDTYIAITEFGKTTTARVVLGYGNATQPGSRHRADQLKFLAEKKLRNALLLPEDIEKNLEKKEVLNNLPDEGTLNPNLTQNPEW